MDILRLFRRSRLEVGTGDDLEVVLRAGRPLRLARARGGRIACTAGCAWITAPGMASDLFLRGGETWQVASDGLVLIEAVGGATVRLLPPS